MDTSTPPDSNLLPLAEAAAMENLNQRALARACSQQRIPVELVCLGPRIRFVKRDQFDRWRHSHLRAHIDNNCTPEEENLFI